MKTNDVEGTIMLSKRRYDAIQYWDAIVEANKEGTILEGTVVEVISKGLIVFVNGIRIFTRCLNPFTIIPVLKNRKPVMHTITAVQATAIRTRLNCFFSSSVILTFPFRKYCSPEPAAKAGCFIIPLLTRNHETRAVKF